MNKKIIIIVVVILIGASILLGGLKIVSNQKDIEKYGHWIENNEFLYDKAIEYLKEEKVKNAKDINEDDYQSFYDYKGFGIKEKDGKKYVYMCVLYQSYYVKHNMIRSSEESYIPCKFVVKYDEVVSYQTPKYGVGYKQSIKEMFPNDIENKVLHYNYNSNILNNYKKLNNHYAYLGIGNAVITYADEGERAIAVYGTYSENSNNTIKGKYIDGYGDIFEYTIPCNKNQELLIKVDYIDKDFIEKYKGNQIGSISKEDLEIIKENMTNMEYKYKNIDNQNDNKFFFIKVLNTSNIIKNNKIKLNEYSEDDFITLIENTENVKEENVSKQSQNIINILKKYEMT